MQYKTIPKYIIHYQWLYNLTADNVGSTLMYKVYMFRLWFALELAKIHFST